MIKTKSHVHDILKTWNYRLWKKIICEQNDIRIIIELSVDELRWWLSVENSDAMR